MVTTFLQEAKHTAEEQLAYHVKSIPVHGLVSNLLPTHQGYRGKYI